MATTIQTADITLIVEKREDRGTNPSGRLRAEGRVPAVLYGGELPPVAISVDDLAVRDILKQDAGENTIFLLKLKNTTEERMAMIKELQVDPISGKFVHIDFIRVTAGHKLNVTIHIDLIGDSVGCASGRPHRLRVARARGRGAAARYVRPHRHRHRPRWRSAIVVTVADLEERLPESAKFLEDPSRVVVVVEQPRLIEEEEEEDLLAEGEEVEEGAEPEIISKGKDEEAGE